MGEGGGKRGGGQSPVKNVHGSVQWGDIFTHFSLNNGTIFPIPISVFLCKSNNIIKKGFKSMHA